MNSDDRERVLCRFWSKVNKTETCWLWTAAVNHGGYGKFTAYFDGGQRDYRAHRFAYEHTSGPIPAGMTLDHLCRVRFCVNPAHMEPVDAIVNATRGGNTLKTHCPQGHPYDMAQADGRRCCRTCRRDQNRNRKRRLRALSAMERTAP